MKMDRDRGIEKHLPLRRVEFHILLSLAAGERHGYGIIQDIEARGETAVPDVGTMYRALARMVEAGSELSSSQALSQFCGRTAASGAVLRERHDVYDYVAGQRASD